MDRDVPVTVTDLSPAAEGFYFLWMFDLYKQIFY